MYFVFDKKLILMCVSRFSSKLGLVYPENTNKDMSPVATQGHQRVMCG